MSGRCIFNISNTQRSIVLENVLTEYKIYKLQKDSGSKQGMGEHDIQFVYER